MSTPSNPSIGGRTVALLESRRATEAADLVRRYGGKPLSLPVLREAPLDNDTESRAALRQLCSSGTDALILLTGVGTRALFDLATKYELGTKLRAVCKKALVVVRGPKPTAVLRELKVRIDRTAESPNTSEEVLAAIAQDPIKRAAVQLYGSPDPLLMDGLRSRGIEVLELPVYRYGFPQNLEPVLSFLRGGDKPDVLAVTSANQVRNLFDIADINGLSDALREKLDGVAVASVGPVSAKGIEEHGLTVAIQPENPTLGALIREIARHCSGAAA
ncbi:MAG: uroporphyrinogen-III synthase [Chloroflexi bacterium]|nr:uroporphyrinogen-III synthase [Chloroflexota bacterium]